MNLVYFKGKNIYKVYEKKYISNIKLARELINTGAKRINLKNKSILDTIIFSISYFYHIYKDEKSLKVIEEIIKNKDLSIQGKIYLYWQLVRIDFIDMKNKGSIDLKNIYKYIEKYIEDEKIIPLPPNIEAPKREDILVFTTNQFIYNDHSPTKVLLSILKKINDNFPKINKIYIFNTREMPFTAEYFFYKPMVANCIEKYDDEILNHLMKEEEIDRCEVYYNQFDESKDVIKRVENAILEIYKLNPKYLISIGGSNIASDLYSKYIDIYTIGISKEIPISNSKFLVNISNVDNIREFNIENNQILLGVPSSITDIKINNNYGNEYSRKDINIPDELFLIVVVGNRLKKELNDEFFDFCNDILNQNNNVGFLFIGPIGDKNFNNKIVNSFRKRIYYINYAENLASAIKLADLYVNPLRLGGGLSAITSIRLGVPVLTNDIGDVGLYLSDFFKVKNYSEMYERVNVLVRDKKIYNLYLKNIKDLYLRNSKSSWDMLLEYILNN